MTDISIFLCEQYLTVNYSMLSSLSPYFSSEYDELKLYCGLSKCAILGQRKYILANFCDFRIHVNFLASTDNPQRYRYSLSFRVWTKVFS